MKNYLPFKILYEDQDLIVINKPAGLLTTHTKVVGRFARETQLTAENLLNDYLRKGQRKSTKRVYLVHRLDRETSGVMMFAKTEAVMNYFRDNWNTLTEKTYLARVEGELKEETGVIESYLRDDPKTMKVKSVADSRFGKYARTEWKKLISEEGTTLVEVTLKSGRKNQIRVHFSELGHPIVGDTKYGGMKASRLYLHSKTLSLLHPHTHKPLSFTAEI